MKNSLLFMAGVMLLGGLGASMLAPTRDDKKPIVVDKMCYAEEKVFQYEEEPLKEYEVVTSLDVKEDEECEDCVSICVRGSYTSMVSPDKATIYAVIENLDTDMKNSKELNYTAFDKVVSSLKGRGLSEEQICLEYFSCCPSYDYSNGRTLQGYMTSTSFTVQVDEIGNLKTYIDAMTENGVTSICNIKYELSDMEEQYSQALSGAYENARTKAEKLLGNEDLKLVRIREEMVFSSNNLCRSYVEGVSTDLIGKVQIEAMVSAEFEAVEGATEV